MQLLTASYPFRVRALSILLLHPAVCGVGTRLTRASYFFFYPFGSAVLRLRRSGRLCIAHGLLCLRVWLPPDRLRHVPSARLTPLSILNLPRALGQLYLQHLASSKPSDDPIAEVRRARVSFPVHPRTLTFPPPPPASASASTSAAHPHPVRVPPRVQPRGRVLAA